uniref:Uncharacterized protein n=1 Tax=Ornithorhynchus anatinus TaxID=9258 RepID=A0A6I8NG21_ORNAN
MPDVEPAAPDFAASGRVGRRNALPDILGPSATAGAPDLPAKLAGLAGAEGNVGHRRGVLLPGVGAACQEFDSRLCHLSAA